MQSHIDGFRGRRIAVWGDPILDEYIFTRAARVSREAPVLIAEHESEAFRLGGAGNVAANIRALGGIPVPVGFVGADQTGDVIRRVLWDSDISEEGLIQIEGFVTPRKTRILSGDSHTRRQQVLRIDRLNRQEASETKRSDLMEKLGEIASSCDFLVISDYLQCSVRGEDLEKIRDRVDLPPTAVDSRRNLRSFSGMRVATPNLPELERLYPGRNLGVEEHFVDAGRKLLGELDARGLLLKRGDEGMVLLEEDGSLKTIGIFGSREIVDVTGAGDTVIAILALGLAAGTDLYTSARLAAVAAGLTVMKVGAATVTPRELSDALETGKLP